MQTESNFQLLTFIILLDFRDKEEKSKSTSQSFSLVQHCQIWSLDLLEFITECHSLSDFVTLICESS